MLVRTHRWVLFVTVMAALLLAVAVSPAVPVAAQTGPIPSIELLDGPGIDICTNTNFPTPIWLRWDGVTRSYSDEMLVPGFGNVSNFWGNYSGSIDSLFSYGWGPSAYSVPDGTIITFRVTSYNGPDRTGGVAYVSTLNVDCTTGLAVIIEDTVENTPGCDALMYIPASAVGATITADTPVYWTPGELSDEVFPAGTTLRAIGVDASGMYTKVLFGCGYYWVPSSAIGPNYDSVWNGAPLPTDVVE